MIYLDNNATTRVDPRVVAAMADLWSEVYGNASSPHRLGTQAAARVELARAQVAERIGARPGEIVFTSGGTESNNAALRGVLAARPEKRHVIVSAVEHQAILEPCRQLEREGVAVTRVPVDRAGRLDLDRLAESFRDDTALVSIMLANNETGVIYPVREVAALAHARGVPVHTDAVNALGKMPVNWLDLDVDLMSLSAHKIHGPKGVGALVIRTGTPFRPLILGGPHERRRRGGTLNVPGIVGFGAACALLAELGDASRERMRARRDRLEAALRERCPGAVILGDETERLPNTSCVCFPGVSSEPVILLLSEAGVCVSAGSACSSGSLEPSHVVQAMGVPPELAQGQIRFSLSRETTAEEIDRVAELMPRVLAKVSAVNP